MTNRLGPHAARTMPAAVTAGAPAKQGLYDPRFEHDACGVAFVVDMHGRRTHRMVELGLQSLCNLDHRGATNAEPNVGDGAGILIQVPDRFLREIVDFELVVRKRVEHEIGVDGDRVYFPSLSSRTIVYKGMLTTPQLRRSSPTCPTSGSRARWPWCTPVLHQHVPVVAAGAPVPLPRPQRRDQHRDGQPQLDAGPRGAAGERPVPRRPGALFPICTPGAQRLASFDEVLELLHLGGSLPHAVLMMIPEAWENHDRWIRPAGLLPVPLVLMEPWDGPANVVFTDGTVIGAVLDRNGLRPGRFWVTDDGLVVLAPRSACSTSPSPTSVVRKGRLQPGRRCSWSTPPRAASSTTTRSRPPWPPPALPGEWLDEGSSSSTTCPTPARPCPATRRSSAASRPSATRSRS
jgi:hypothetical protein